MTSNTHDKLFRDWEILVVLFSVSRTVLELNFQLHSFWIALCRNLRSDIGCEAVCFS